MEDRVEGKAPFDDRAALEGLERLRQQIARYKSERQAVGDEFDQFVRSFKTPAAAQAPQQAPTVLHAGTGNPPADPSAARSSSPGEFAPTVLQDGETIPIEPLLAAPAPRQATSRTRARLAGALILMIGVGLVTWTLWKAASDSSTPASDVPAPPAAVSTVAAPSPVPAPMTPSPIESVITTTRRVWIRVLVDGNRVLERELPADMRVSLKAKKTIVIRTGDAGAVRLSIGGHDQGVLGGTGEVLTRTFAVPGAAAR